MVPLRPGATSTDGELRTDARDSPRSRCRSKCGSGDEPLPRSPAGKVLKRERRDAVLGTDKANGSAKGRPHAVVSIHVPGLSSHCHYI